MSDEIIIRHQDRAWLNSLSPQLRDSWEKKLRDSYAAQKKIIDQELSPIRVYHRFASQYYRELKLYHDSELDWKSSIDRKNVERSYKTAAEICQSNHPMIKNYGCLEFPAARLENFKIR